MRTPCLNLCPGLTECSTVGLVTFIQIVILAVDLFVVRLRYVSRFGLLLCRIKTCCHSVCDVLWCGRSLYRVIHEESSIFWVVIEIGHCEKNKVHMNVCLIWNS
jgi:hypothetical protein